MTPSIATWIIFCIGMAVGCVITFGVVWRYYENEEHITEIK